jgi:acyl carrier protein
MAENSDNSVFERVKAVIVEVLNVEESKIGLDSNMRNDLGADSIDLMTLIVALEEEFDGQIADEEVQNLLTVGNTVDFIQDKIIKS